MQVNNSQIALRDPSPVASPAYCSTPEANTELPQADTYDTTSALAAEPAVPALRLPRLRFRTAVAAQRAATLTCVAAATYGLSLIGRANAEPVTSVYEFTQEGLIIHGGQCSWTCTANSLHIAGIAGAAGVLGGVIFGQAASISVVAWFRELKLLCEQVGCPTVWN